MESESPCRFVPCRNAIPSDKGGSAFLSSLERFPSIQATASGASSVRDGVKDNDSDSLFSRQSGWNSHGQGDFGAEECWMSRDRACWTKRGGDDCWMSHNRDLLLADVNALPANVAGRCNICRRWSGVSGSCENLADLCLESLGEEEGEDTILSIVEEEGENTKGNSNHSSGEEDGESRRNIFGVNDNDIFLPTITGNKRLCGRVFVHGTAQDLIYFAEQPGVTEVISIGKTPEKFAEENSFQMRVSNVPQLGRCEREKVWLKNDYEEEDGLLILNGEVEAESQLQNRSLCHKKGPVSDGAICRSDASHYATTTAGTVPGDSAKSTPESGVSKKVGFESNFTQSEPAPRSNSLDKPSEAHIAAVIVMRETAGKQHQNNGHASAFVASLGPYYSVSKAAVCIPTSVVPVPKASSSSNVVVRNASDHSSSGEYSTVAGSSSGDSSSPSVVTPDGTSGATVPKKSRSRSYEPSKRGYEITRTVTASTAADDMVPSRTSSSTCVEDGSAPGRTVSMNSTISTDFMPGRIPIGEEAPKRTASICSDVRNNSSNANSRRNNSSSSYSRRNNSSSADALVATYSDSDFCPRYPGHVDPASKVKIYTINATQINQYFRPGYFDLVFDRNALLHAPDRNGVNRREYADNIRHTISKNNGIYFLMVSSESGFNTSRSGESTGLNSLRNAKDDSGQQLSELVEDLFLKPAHDAKLTRLIDKRWNRDVFRITYSEQGQNLRWM